jgi:hypothetical protein
VSWKTVARATVDSEGKYKVEQLFEPGRYRARVAPGRGLVPGMSAVVDL